MHKKYQLPMCRVNFFSCALNRLVFLLPNEGKKGPEALIEKPKIIPFEGNILFDGSSPLNSNIINLMRSAMGEDYRDFVTVDILRNIREDQFSEKQRKKEFKRIKLSNGVIYFLGENDKQLAAIDVSKELREIVDDYGIDTRSNLYKRARNQRLYYYASHATFRDPNYPYLVGREFSPGGSKGTPAKAPSAEQRLAAQKSGNRPPLTKEQEQAAAEIKALYLSKSVTRRDILATVEPKNNPDYDILMNVDRTLCDSNGKEFFELWREMEHFSEIDALFEEEGQSQEGYMVNPLKEAAQESKHGGHLEVLRNLIQHRFNHRLYLKEVLDLVYAKRFDTFKKNLLETHGIPKELVDLLDKNDCIKSYRLFKDLARKLGNKEQVPEQFKKFEPHLDKMKVVVAILGDYIAYGTRLVQLVDQLAYNPAQEQKEHAKLMFERREGTSKEALEANQVIDALTVLFRDADAPTVYTSELRHLFAGWSEKEITFQDLNGNVMSAKPVEEDWFTLYQSGDTAYKMAFEASENTSKRNPDGSTYIDKLAAKKYLNDSLQLGITAYPALPVDSKESLKSIIDRLSRVGATVESGVPLKFTGNLTVDARNLYYALALDDVSDVHEQKSLGSKKERLLAAQRAKFIRIGSVIKQKDLAKRQERESREAPRTAAAIKFLPEHAEEIAGQMRATKKFTEGQIGDFKKLLIGGGAVVLPDHGGGFMLNYPFANGVSIKITGFLENWKGGLGVGGGLAVGYNFETSNNVTVSIDAGGGFSMLGGWFVGTSGRVTKKFSSVDFYAEGGGGFLFGGVAATGFVGLGLDWAKYKENYQRILHEENIEHHIAELGENPYEKVKANPGKYPELAHILYQLKNTGLPLDASSEKDVFNGIYEVFREGIQNKAVDRSVPAWWKRFLSTEIGLGLAVFQTITGQPPILVPYLKVSFALWKRTVVYRLATNPKYIKQLGEDQATQAIKESLAKSGEKIEQAKQLLRTGSELLLDPKSGELMLRASRRGKIDFSFVDEKAITQFERMRQELGNNADISVDPAEAEAKGMGLVLLSPQKAHGDVFLHIDPALKENAIVVTRGDKLYLSVKKGTQLYFKRQDVTYPFKVSQYRPGPRKKTKDKKSIPIVEDTFISISSSPWHRQEVIQANSEYFLMQRPGSDWIKREGVKGRTPVERLAKKQGNIRTFEEHRTSLAVNKPIDRIEFEPYSSRREEIERAYERLREITELEEREKADSEIDEAKVNKIIETLVHDEEFRIFYKLHWTRGYPLLRTQKRAYLAGDYGEKFAELIKNINEKINQPLNPLELDAILLALFIDRLSVLPEKDKEPQAFEKKLREVFTELLTAMFSTYYEGRPDRDTKVTAAVEYTLSELKTADMRKEKAKPVDRGALFGTLVGTPDRPKGKHIFGMASYQNFRDSVKEWGVIGRKVLDPTRQDINGEVGRFWLNSLSPYEPGLQNKPIPKPGEARYAEYQVQMYANLKSRLAIRLRPIITLVLEPEEIMELTEIYAGGHTLPGEKLSRPRIAISEKNIAVVKKFLDECDKIRAAELRGEKEVRLNNPDFIVRLGYYEHKKNSDGKPLYGPDGKPIQIFHHVGAQVFHGIYKKCGNPSGLLLEEFEAVYLPQSTRPKVYAGQGQVIHDVSQFQGARVVHLNLGLAKPFEVQKIEPTLPRDIPPPEPGPKPQGAPPTAWRPPPPTGTRPDTKLNAPEEQPNEGI